MNIHAITPFLRDISLSFVVAVGFAILFNSPRRILWVAGLLGGLGHCIRFAMTTNNIHIVPATLCAAIFIGFAGIIMAHEVHTPPVVFTMPACITMIPGLPAYRTMLGCIKITNLDVAKQEPTHLAETAYHFVLTASLLFALAVGICAGALFFRKRSIKSLFRRTF